MGDGLRFVRANDPAWDDIMARCHTDFYHRRAYHLLAEAHGEGDAWLAAYSDGGALLAWPYLCRPIDGSAHIDATGVYGYSGPVVGGDIVAASRPEFLGAAWAAFRSGWREQGVVSMFTRLNPLIGNQRIASAFCGDAPGPVPPVLTLGRSVSMDLTLDDDTRRAGYDKESRYEIRRAARKGLVVQRDHDFVHLERLVEAYHQTMSRNAAEQRYLFSLQYFRDLVAALAGDAHLVVASAGGDVVGGLLFITHGALAQAHLTGILDEYLRLSPLKVLLDEAAIWARELGADVLHLGAGRNGAEDSLFDFKRRIAPVLHEFVIGRWVLDGAVYCDLCGLGPGVATDLPSFFPAYRAPELEPLP